MTGSPHVLLTLNEGLAILTLTRPAARNALDVRACEQFEALAEEIAENEDVRAILIRAEGKHFCVGGDVSGMKGQAEERVRTLGAMVEPLHRGLSILARLDAPLVVAVRGAAAGAGLSLVAAADLVVASKTAKFVMAYSAIGLSPDLGATWSLPRAIGVRRTLELALTNRCLDAAEALDWGLVTELVDDDQLDRVAMERARSLSAGPTAAFGAVRRLVAASLFQSLDAQLDAELAAIRMTGATEDTGIGIGGFLGRRPPQFVGG